MKLYQLKIDNVLIDLNSSYTAEQINGRPAFLALLDNQSAPADYQDVSTIANWHNYWRYVEGQFGCKDWKALRREIWALVLPIVTSDWSGWNNLTEEEKYLTCYYLPNKVPLNLFTTTITSYSEQAEISVRFDTLSQQARQQRVQVARPFVFGNLPIDQCIVLIDKTYLLNLKYYQGVEDKATDGVEGLFDYITSAANTSYANNGLLQEPFTPYVLTMQQLSDNLMSILKDGYY